MSTPRPQQTISTPVSFSGRGLFHGIEVDIRLLPADADTGIVFRRIDLTDVPDIPAHWKYVQTVPRRTVIGVSEEVRVETIEHLMAALAGLQIDNCIVEINAPEVPAYDSSCRDFCDGILTAGVTQLDSPIRLNHIDRVLSVQSVNRQQSVVMRPYIRNCAAFTYHLDYGVRSPVEAQHYSVEITQETFLNEIAAARTFVLESEVKALQGMGYGRHLTAKDIVVVGDQGVIDNELRWQNEGARHKILDCIGDLALSQTPFFGHVTACRSGHHLNHQLAVQLDESASTMEYRNAA